MPNVDIHGNIHIYVYIYIYMHISIYTFMQLLGWTALRQGFMSTKHCGGGSVETLAKQITGLPAVRRPPQPAPRGDARGNGDPHFECKWHEHGCNGLMVAIESESENDVVRAARDLYAKEPMAVLSSWQGAI